jgi:hypothetical protein
MTRRILLSIVAFSLFAFAGPIIRAVFPPALPPGNSRQQILTDLVMLLWPTSFLGVGRPVNGQTQLSLMVYNVIFFAVLGLLLASIARRPWVVLIAYLATCFLLAAMEAWGSGYALAYFSWSALGVALLLYALPFLAVGRMVWTNTPISATVP